MAETKGYIKSSDEKGSVNIAQNVITTIAAAAVVDVDGVYGLYQSPGKELIEVTGKKGISRDVKITIEEDNIVADVYLISEAGHSVSEIGASVQKAVMDAVEEAVGVKVNTVNVNICGISMKKAAVNRGSVDTRKAAKKPKEAAKTEKQENAATDDEAK